MQPFDFIAPGADPRVAEEAGFRFGPKGTHTSRTIMVADLTSVFEACDAGAGSDDYTSAIVGENCLGKATSSTRRSSRQRLGELYALDPVTPLFRVLRKLWNLTEGGRPTLALLAALARDPLLRATAAAVMSLRKGEVLTRPPLIAALRRFVGPRLNDGVLDKVARNAASSWSQTGHLVGRTHKVRQQISPSPAAVAFALYLGDVAGFRGDDLLASAWLRVLDVDDHKSRDLAVEARRLGLIDLRTAGDVLSLSLDRLDPWYGRRRIGTN
jgi:hypothetical protein